MMANFIPILFPPQGLADRAWVKWEKIDVQYLGFQFIVHIPLSFWGNLIKKKTNLVFRSLRKSITF